MTAAAKWVAAVVLSGLSAAMTVFGVVNPPVYSVTLAWDPSNSPDVTGYKVYYGTSSGDYSSVITVGSTTCTIPHLLGGVTCFFAVTAFDSSGLESEFSNEIAYTPALPKSPELALQTSGAGPPSITFTGEAGKTYEILASTNLADWTLIETLVMVPSGSCEFTDLDAAHLPSRFYQARLKQ